VDPERLTIVGLGDSTTAGTPGFRSPLEAPPNGAGNPESQYTYWISNLHPGWLIFNRGINGEESAEILARLPRDVISRKPDYAVILAGVNDVYRGRSLRSVETNLSKMYAQAGTGGIRVIAASVLPFNSMSRKQAREIRELNVWIEEEAKRSGMVFCDTNSLTADPTDRDRLASSADGLHPDVNGYRRMGEGLARAIEDALSR
jgi:acyl-CoA thioesterase I